MFVPRNGKSTVPLHVAPLAQGVERGRRMYRAAAEELFALCYAIQVTGNLPDPVSLTEALIEYRRARALVALLNPQPFDAQDEETLPGTPAGPRRSELQED